MPWPSLPERRAGSHGRRLGWVALGCAVFGWGCSVAESPPAPPPLRVATAASLEEVTTRAARLWEAAGGRSVEINAAGTATLARQIQRADVADLFLSADRVWIERLGAAGHLRDDVVELWQNRLVIVTRPGALPALQTVDDLLDPSVRHVATGDADSVPVGRYARQALGEERWAALDGRLVPTADVRAALALAAANSRVAAIVYATDVPSAGGSATGSRPTVELRLELATPQGLEIAAFGALIQGSRESATAAEFLSFLTSPQVAALAADLGFRTARPSAPDRKPRLSQGNESAP